MNGSGLKAMTNSPPTLLEGIAKQASVWMKFFPHLRYKAMAMYEKELPKGAEGFLLIPDPLELESDNYELDYDKAIRILADLLVKERGRRLLDGRFDLDPACLERKGRILELFERLREEQSGNLFIVPINVSRHNKVCALPFLDKGNEREAFFGIFECMCLLLTNPDSPLLSDFSVINCLGDGIIKEKDRNELWVPSIILAQGGFRLKKVSISDCGNELITPAIVL